MSPITPKISLIQRELGLLHQQRRLDFLGTILECFEQRALELLFLHVAIINLVRPPAAPRAETQLQVAVLGFAAFAVNVSPVFQPPPT